MQRYDKPVRPSLSQAEYQRIAKEQAAERLRRGLADFTRPAQREQVMGATPAESRLNTAHRYQGVNRRGKK